MGSAHDQPRESARSKEVSTKTNETAACSILHDCVHQARQESTINNATDAKNASSANSNLPSLTLVDHSMSPQQQKAAQAQAGDGPYQVASRLLGKGASGDEVMALTHAMKDQYKAETGGKDPLMKDLAVGQSLMNDKNYDQIMGRIGNDGMRQTISADLAKGGTTESNSQAAKSDNAQKSGQTVKPDQVPNSDHTAKPEHAAKHEHAENPKHATKHDHASKPDHSTNPEHATNPEHSAKPEQAAKPESKSSSDHVAKSDNAQKSAQTVKPDQAPNSDQTAKTDHATNPHQTSKTDQTAKPEENGVQPNSASALSSAQLNALFDQAAKGYDGKANRIEDLKSGAVFFRAKMDIDDDGSPRAKQLDPKDGDPETSLRYPDKHRTPVNAETMPYIVMPSGKYQGHGVALGDMAAVRYDGKVAFAIFADAGPAGKKGEASMALAKELGINNNPRYGGVDTAKVEYMVFPGSGDGTPGTKEANDAKALAELKKHAR